MARADRPGYRLTPAAVADLADIWGYSFETWGLAQADRYVDGLLDTFDTIAAMPEIARERPEFDPPVRIHPSAQHVVVYLVEEGDIAILRVLGGRQNWQAVLKMGLV